MSSPADLFAKAGRPTRQPSRVAKLAIAAAVYSGILATANLVSVRGSDQAMAALPDRGGPQDGCSVWFVGSSSIHRWTTLADDVRPWTAHNRGVDGATIRDITARFGNEPPAARPRAIVFYGGDNDIAFGQSGADAIRDLRDFLAARQRRMGDVPVFIVALKPSPARWSLRAEQTAFNRAARALAATDPSVRFVDVVPQMLADGVPGPYYAADGIHLNGAGYRIWSEAVNRALTTQMPRPLVRACSRTRATHARLSQMGG